MFHRLDEPLRGLAASVLSWQILGSAAAGFGPTGPPPQMQFYCNTGYSLESCRAHVAALQRVLSTAPELGAWTWVLVRSEDWKPILLTRAGLDPDSPAFTVPEKRQTFLEEALFTPLPGRSATLLEKFRLPLDQLLEHAVLHELAHALCKERDERQTDIYARQLREGTFDRCSGHDTGIVTSAGPTRKADAAAVRAAIELLPTHPTQVAVIDVTRNRPDVRDHLLTLDAFTVPGNDVVYLVQQSQVLTLARSGAPFNRALLASIIWHEMAHLRGEDERQARRAEQDIWQRFVRDGVTDQLIAMRYLKILEQRPDDRPIAAR